MNQARFDSQGLGDRREVVYEYLRLSARVIGNIRLFCNQYCICTNIYEQN